MTVLTRWEPFREFSTMQDRMNRMNRLFRESYSPEGPEEAYSYGQDYFYWGESRAGCVEVQLNCLTGPCSVLMIGGQMDIVIVGALALIAALIVGEMAWVVRGREFSALCRQINDLNRKLADAESHAHAEQEKMNNAQTDLAAANARLGAGVLRRPVELNSHWCVAL
jgi:outer membrane murein-binding lipoprotein Lpp